MGEELILVQDNAAAHAARTTQEDLQEREVSWIEWPPCCPDLKPIETVWNKMKNWIQEKYTPGALTTYDTLREAVTSAWQEAISAEYLQELVDGMPARCQAVLDVNGG